MLEKAAKVLTKGIYPVSRVACAIGVAVMALIVIMVVVDVLARRLLNAPISGVLELTKVCLLLVVFLTLAYCGAKGGHVEMDVLTTRFPKRVQSILAVVMYIISALMLGVAGWRLLVQGLDVQASNQTSGLLEIPVFPFYYIAALGTVLLALVFLIQFLNHLEESRH